MHCLDPRGLKNLLQSLARRVVSDRADIWLSVIIASCTGSCFFFKYSLFSLNMMHSSFKPLMREAELGHGLNLVWSRDLWEMAVQRGRGYSFYKRVAFGAAWVFNGTTASSLVCPTYSLDTERNRASENYFHGVAMFTVSWCLFLEIQVTGWKAFLFKTSFSPIKRGSAVI